MKAIRFAALSATFDFTVAAARATRKEGM